jgi:hypothetical protein
VLSYTRREPVTTSSLSCQRVTRWRLWLPARRTWRYAARVYSTSTPNLECQCPRCDTSRQKLHDELPLMIIKIFEVHDPKSRGSQCAEKLRTMCTASIKMHDAICHLEGATVDQGGVGIKIAETTSGTLIVDNLLREGAAEKTGKIFVGDALLSINGVSTEKMTVEEAREQIVGDVGLPVTLEVQQQNARKTRCTVTIFRGLRGGKDDVIAQMVIIHVPSTPKRAPLCWAAEHNDLQL